jgi:hypothetical protein
VYVDRYSYKSSGDLFANAGLSAGISRFVSARTAIDFYVGYKFAYTSSHTTGTFSRDYSDPTTGDLSLKPDYDEKFTNHGVMLGIGFQVFIEKKK